MLKAGAGVWTIFPERNGARVPTISLKQERGEADEDCGMREYTEEELRLLTEILPNIGTEMRDAVSSIYGAVMRLAPERAQEADPAVKKNAAIFMHGYCRMLRIVGNLSRAELLVKSAPPELRNLDFVGLCRDVCREAEALFELKKVTLTFESDVSGGVLAADEAQIKRLLLNLLSNALRYTPEGGTVTVRVTWGERFAQLSVSDTGCGIAPEKLETVFERFLHTDLLDASPHGVGLGLALCRRIAEDHGGRIVAESTLGEGATFTVSLPRRTTRSAVLRSPRIAYAGGLNETLVELSDALPTEAFTYLHLH